MSEVYTSRSDLSGLIPEPVTREIMQGTVENSAVMSMGRRLPNMTSGTQTMNVLDMLPMAYFVNGDTGYKKTTKMKWDKKKIYAEEIAVIVPIAEAVLDDADYDIWGEAKPRIQAAFGQVFDAAVLFGTNKPSSWRAGLVPSAISAGNEVQQTSTPDVYQDLLGPGGVFSHVEADGFDVNGVMAGISMKSVLRGLTDQVGRPIYKHENIPGRTQYDLDGVPMNFPKNGSFDETASLLIAGDFNELVYAIRKDITYKILTEATIQDPSDGSIVYNLAQQDMVALRCVMRIGWEIPNPINYLQPTAANRFPFAVYTPYSD